MKLIQKNVKVPQEAWDRLRRNAQATGVPVCVFLTHLIGQSHPLPADDVSSQEELRRIERQRGRGIGQHG